MDGLTLIGGLGSGMFGAGMVSLLDFGLTRKEKKRAAVLENEAKQQDIKQDYDKNTVDLGERLSHQYEHDLEYHRSLINERDILISEKDKTIEELRDQVNCLTSSITQAQMLRCDKASCIDRIPPFGYKKIDFRTGELID